MLDDDVRVLRTIFSRTGGRPFEPNDRRHPMIARAIAGGYLRWVDGRCGFERFRNSHLAFTDSALLAFSPEAVA